MHPVWLVDLLAGVMLATAAYCAGRLVAAAATGRLTHRDVDVAHVAMGVAMAGALVPALRLLPDGAWEALFAVLGGWFALAVGRFVRWHGWRGWSADECHHVSHYASHLVMSAAMVYMFGAGAVMTSSGAMAASDLSTSGLPLLLVLLLMVAAVWYADSLARFSRPVPAPAPAVELEPAVAYAGASGRDTRTIRASRVLRACDGRWLAPRQQVAAHMAMCVVMAYMLVVMQ
jgi:hypothetical protein